MTWRIGMVAGEASSDLIASSALEAWREMQASSSQDTRHPASTLPSGRAGNSATLGGVASGAVQAHQKPVAPRQLQTDADTGASPGVPAVQCAGIGGPAMQAQGFETWWPSEWLAVHGYSAAIRALPKLLWVRYQLRQRLLKWPADAFIGVDAPDFNLGLEMKLKAAGVRTYHFVSPSIWAWRRERIEKIRQAVDHMLLVFPFEEAIYREAGIPATYCGHPLADQIPLQADQAAARRTLGLTEKGTVVALLPGSRQAEVEHLAPVFLAAARILHQRHPDWQFVLPAAGESRLAQIRQILHQQRLAEGADLSLRPVTDVPAPSAPGAAAQPGRITASFSSPSAASSSGVPTSDSVRTAAESPGARKADAALPPRSRTAHVHAEGRPAPVQVFDCDALPLRVVLGHSHTVLAACDQTLIASGTATLEAALFKRPMVIAYRMAALSYRLMKGRNYQPWFGLPNIMANEFLVPEYIQDAATPEALADAVEKQVLDTSTREHLIARFDEMHRQLARGCARTVANTVLDDLGRHGRR